MIERRTIKFFVDRKEHDGGKTFVIGRCLEAPIFVGDHFEGVYAMTSTPGERPDFRPLPLDVVGIDWWPVYGMDHIDSSYTGRLQLSGSAADEIRDGEDILLGTCQSA